MVVYLKHSLEQVSVEETSINGEKVYYTSEGIVYKEDEVVLDDCIFLSAASSFCNHNGCYICRTCNRMAPCEMLKSFLTDLNY